ncbi:MAG: hypothetical protein A2078_04325 [Nitrospirae bacterium GWC2_57_9]|nr:MAG: hypothetical protein A2078_04325 [Nitrospirae bacterium GWC2_57_9]
MKIKSGIAGLIASVLLFAGFAVAQQSGSPESDPAMQQSQSGSEQQMSQGAMTQDPATVKQVQQALSNQGFDPGPADGKWGSKSQGALKKFQQSQGMQASGQLDQQTLASLGVSGAAAGGGGQGSTEDQSGAGGQPGDMPDQQSSPGGQPGDMQDQQSAPGGQPGDMQDQQSSAPEQPGGSKY